MPHVTHPAASSPSWSATPPLQQYHTFRLHTPCQAEELNAIVGTAFRAAYALQIQREGQVVRRVGEQRMRISRSSEHLLCSSDENSQRSLTSTTSAMPLVQTDASTVTFPEYSEVFDMANLQGNLDSMAQDSGISSTSGSTTSYSSQQLFLNTEDHEDLSTAPWYQAGMQR